MMRKSFNEESLMMDLTNVTNNSKLDEFLAIAANTDISKSQASEVVSDTYEAVPTVKSLDHPKYSKHKRRKKSKPKSNHLPNMKNKAVKSALGSTILGLLGRVQKDTQIAYKKALLNELPLADLVEVANKEKLPDYQANLLNYMQTKVAPGTPISIRMRGDNSPASDNQVIVTYDEMPFFKEGESPLTGAELDIVRKVSPVGNLLDSTE